MKKALSLIPIGALVLSAIGFSCTKSSTSSDSSNSGTVDI